jgi:hypothetical protein
MCPRATEEALPDESLTQSQLDIFLRPLLGRQGLQKHENFLEVHFDQLLGPLDQERSTHIQVEL